MIKPETGPGADRTINFPFLWLIGLRSLRSASRERGRGGHLFDLRRFAGNRRFGATGDVRKGDIIRIRSQIQVASSIFAWFVSSCAMPVWFRVDEHGGLTRRRGQRLLRHRPAERLGRWNSGRLWTA